MTDADIRRLRWINGLPVGAEVERYGPREMSRNSGLIFLTTVFAGDAAVLRTIPWVAVRWQWLGGQTNRRVSFLENFVCY